uniref:Uncharacterized protein n=1 Tax=Arundo donax TaxID=35708 RepID=A0A0A9FIA9_ARUDO
MRTFFGPFPIHQTIISEVESLDRSSSILVSIIVRSFVYSTIRHLHFWRAYSHKQHRLLNISRTPLNCMLMFPFCQIV